MYRFDMCTNHLVLIKIIDKHKLFLKVGQTRFSTYFSKKNFFWDTLLKMAQVYNSPPGILLKPGW